MSREEKINKMIEDIEIRRNDEQYRGGPFPIYHIEFDILKEEIERLNNIINEEHRILNGELRKELQQKENIIKEVREKIEGIRIYGLRSGKTLIATLLNDILEILDKGSDKE